MAFNTGTLTTNCNTLAAEIEAESSINSPGAASDQTDALVAYEAQAKIVKASASTVTALLRAQTALNSLLRAIGFGPVVGATDTVGG